MPVFSKITVEFLVDFNEDYTCKIAVTDQTTSSNLGIWSWVTTRSSANQVTTGTPTATAGETTASNFETAFDLDITSDYVTTVTSNEIEIGSEDELINFIGFTASDDNGNVLVEGTDYNVTFENIEVVIDITNVEFVLSKSPHYINTPFDFETTTKATFEIYIWSGDITSVPSSATYTLTKVRPTVDYSEFNTNISNIISEKLDGRPNVVIASTTQIVNSLDSEVKWVKWVASYTDDIENIAERESILIASEGYGYYSEGVNPTKPSNDILTSCVYRKVSRDGVILLPFVNNGTITSIDIDSETNEIDENEVITSGNNSNTAIQYLNIDVSQATTDNYITVTFKPSGDIVTYEIVDECKFSPVNLLFKNRYGVFENITFFKKSIESISTSNEEFVNSYINNGSFDTTKHQYQKINIQGKKSISLKSGYITEDENSLYEELMLSDKVFIYDGTLNPVNIVNKNLEFKTRLNDKLINYDIDLEYSYNLIQNI